MVLDKNVEKEINGKVYNFCLPIKYVFRAERELANKNLIATMAKISYEPLCYEDCYTLFKYCLIGGGTKPEAVEEVFFEALEELTLPGVMNLTLEVLQKSGVFGKQKKE